MYSQINKIAKRYILDIVVRISVRPIANQLTGNNINKGVRMLESHTYSRIHRRRSLDLVKWRKMIAGRRILVEGEHQPNGKNSSQANDINLPPAQG